MDKLLIKYVIKNNIALIIIKGKILNKINKLYYNYF